MFEPSPHTGWSPRPGAYQGQPLADYRAGYSDAFYGHFGAGVDKPNEAYRKGFADGRADEAAAVPIDDDAA